MTEVKRYTIEEIPGRMALCKFVDSADYDALRDENARLTALNEELVAAILKAFPGLIESMIPDQMALASKISEVIARTAGVWDQRAAPQTSAVPECDHLFVGPAASFADAVCMKGCGMTWREVEGSQTPAAPLTPEEERSAEQGLDMIRKLDCPDPDCV